MNVYKLSYEIVKGYSCLSRLMNTKLGRYAESSILPKGDVPTMNDSDNLLKKDPINLIFFSKKLLKLIYSLYTTYNLVIDFMIDD